VETEIFHELPVILVDRCGHLNGPMIIAFVHLASKGFQSLLADRQFHGRSRIRWLTSGRFTNLGAGPRSGWICRHNISLTASFRREPEQVADDVRKGFVSIEAAARRYGVALNPGGTVDAAKTSALRAKAPEPDTIDPARAAWDEIFPDAEVTALNRRLYGLPPGPANHRRSRIFARVLGDLDAGQIAATSRAERTTRRALFSDLVSAEVAQK